MKRKKRPRKLKDSFRLFKTNYALEPSALFLNSTAPVQLWFDGACWPGSNGGHTSWGLVVKVDGEVVHSSGGYMGKGAGLTNNVGEYQGCIEAFKYLLENNITEATIFGDSNMVIQQMEGRWKARSGSYVPYYEIAWALRVQLPGVRLYHIPRLLNTEADALAGAAGGR